MFQIDKPLPAITEDGAPYWAAARESRLAVQQCSACGHRRFPPSVLCPKCLAFEHEWKPLSGRGTIYSFIIMFIALKTFTYNPELLAKYSGAIFGLGISVGLGEFSSAWVQGLIGAAAIRCLSESEGKGFAYLVIAMGISETVGLFSWILAYLLMPVA